MAETLLQRDIVSKMLRRLATRATFVTDTKNLSETLHTRNTVCGRASGNNVVAFWWCMPLKGAGKTRAQCGGNIAATRYCFQNVEAFGHARNICDGHKKSF